VGLLNKSVPFFVPLFTKWTGLCLAFALLFSFYSFAQLPPTPEAGFGMEVTVTSRVLRNSPLLRKTKDDDTTTAKGLELIEKLAQKIQKACRRCIVESRLDKWEIPSYVVTFPSGWWFAITLDPDVLEFVAAPIHSSDKKQLLPLIQKYIYDFSAQLGLHPERVHGGGHIHLGIESAFDFDPLLFRNFIVDQFNHPELSGKIFAIDPDSAPTIMERKGSERKAFQGILAKFDQKLIEAGIHTVDWWRLSRKARHQRGLDLILWFADQIEKEVYTSTTNKGWEKDKSQAWSFVRVTNRELKPEQLTLESRGLSPQPSAKDLFLMFEMYSTRLHLLREKGGFIPFIPYNYAEASNKELSMFFLEYLEEIHMKAQDFKNLVDSRVRYWLQLTKSCSILN